MKDLRLVKLLTIVIATVGVATAALAQESQQSGSVAASFADLRAQIPDGDTLKVTPAHGEEITGKLRRFDLELGQMVIDVGGADVILAENDVRFIIVEEKDSLRNGALIGLAAGAGPILAIGLPACGGDGECSAFVGLSAAFWGGIGSGIGALIDYAVKTDRLAYVAGLPEPLSFSVAPIITRDAKGAALTISF